MLFCAIRLGTPGGYYSVQLTRPRNTALMLFSRLSARRRRSCGTCRVALNLANDCLLSCSLRLSIRILLFILWNGMQPVSAPTRHGKYTTGRRDCLDLYQQGGRKSELSANWRGWERVLPAALQGGWCFSILDSTPWLLRFSQRSSPPILPGHIPSTC